MSRIVQRSRRDLHEIANRASISSAAREAILARAEAPVHERVEPIDHREEVVMLEKNRSEVRRPAWSIVAVAAAVVAIVVVGAGVLISLGGDDGDVAVTGVPADSGAPIVADPAEPASGDVGTMNGWRSVLEGVTAGVAPEAAACPGGSAVDFDEPVSVPAFLQPRVGPLEAVAAFDSVTNSVVVVRRGAHTVDGVSTRSTVAGRLDVCSGEWSPMNADFGPAVDGEPEWLDALVYDVDSDALVGFSRSGVHVYDRAADEWSIQPYDSIGGVIQPYRTIGAVTSAAYHPASGRILVVAGGSLAAYDVDRAEWELIFQPRYDPFEGEILGIDATLDRIVMAEGVGISGSRPQVTDVTRLVDPVTGEYIDISTPGRPIADIYNGWGPSEAVGQIAGTVFVSDHDNGTICGFNGETLAWDLCVDSPLVEGTPSSSGWAGRWAIVGDPINDQLIAIPPSGRLRTTPLP